MKFNICPLLAAVITCIPLTDLAHSGERGVTSDRILLGQSAALSGPNSPKVAATISGYRLYFDSVNAKGGINGRKVEIVSLDDAYEPIKSLKNTERLISQDKVFALFKYYGSATLRAALPLISKEEMLLIAPSAASNSLRHPVDPNVFCFKPGNFDEAEAIVDYLTSKLALKDIGVFYQDDAFGVDGKNGVSKALNARGLKLAAMGTHGRNSVDVSQAVETLRKAHPKAVVIWSTSAATEAFLNASKKAGFEPVMMAASSLTSQAFARTAWEAGYKDFLVVSGQAKVDYNSKLGCQFHDAIEKSKIVHDDNVFEGYFDAAVLAEALRLAGRDLTKKSLVNAFEKQISSVSINGVNPRFSATNHQGFSQVRVMHLKSDHSSFEDL